MEEEAINQDEVDLSRNGSTVDYRANGDKELYYLKYYSMLIEQKSSLIANHIADNKELDNLVDYSRRLTENSHSLIKQIEAEIQYLRNMSKEK